MNDCTPQREQSGPQDVSAQANASRRRLISRRERAGRAEAEAADLDARFDFALADEFTFLAPDGSACQLAMRLTHRRTGQEQCVVICRRTPAGEVWEALCSPWFDDEAALYIRAVQTRVAANRARRLGPAPGRE